MTILSCLPIAASIDSTETSGRSEDTFVILAQKIVVNPWLTIKVIASITFGYQLEDIIKSLLILCQENKVSATIDRRLSCLQYAAGFGVNPESLSDLPPVGDYQHKSGSELLTLEIRLSGRRNLDYYTLS